MGRRLSCDCCRGNARILAWVVYGYMAIVSAFGCQGRACAMKWIVMPETSVSASMSILDCLRSSS